MRTIGSDGATLIRRLFSFGLVGGIGFIVDAGTLLFLVKMLGLPPFGGRILSFITAATVTFVLNQRFTFKIDGPFSLKRWSFYLTTTAIGACINVGVYQVWLTYHGAAPVHLVIGTALGSLTAMSVNYFISSTLIFPTVK